MREVSLTDWWIAYIVTAVVVVLVVALVSVILEYTRRIGKLALLVTEAMDEIRQRTMPLRDVRTVADGLNEAAESLARSRAEREAR